jgi:hypothetical protein
MVNPSALARLAEVTVVTDQRSTPRPILAPDQGSSKLERVGRSKFVNTKQALGTLSHLFGRLNLVPAVTQIVKACKGLPVLINP